MPFSGDPHFFLFFCKAVEKGEAKMGIVWICYCGKTLLSLQQSFALELGVLPSPLCGFLHPV